MIHNRYQQAGGEDIVFAAEAALLRERGHEVVEYVESNERINRMSWLAATAQVIWSRPSHQELLQVLDDACPDVAHFHNTFLLISPSAYFACRKAGVPVIQTLHNYRLLCPAATCFRDSHVCEDCVGKRLPWPGVVHACYHGSRSQTGVIAVMLTTHRWLRTWQRRVDVYIALTEFSRNKFVEGGLPARKIVVKPNFLHPDPGPGEKRRGYALFVGRLSPEKGLDILLAAWERLGGKVPLKIAGDGPLALRVIEAADRIPRVEWLGQRPLPAVHTLMGEAAFLVFPSEWYETFGRVAIEAFAKGTPVIASDIGALTELVEQGRTGLRFHPGDPESLAAEVEWAWSHPDQMRQMGREARAEYEREYTAEQNYSMLMAVYDKAIATRQSAADA
jgi:glycosyltransferase involved in cell wall biosynthesis